MYNMRTSNPALRAFRSPAMYGGFRDFEKMSVSGTVNATLVLLAVLVITALFTWYLLFVQGAFSLVIILMIGGAIGGLVLAIVTIFKKEWSPFTAPAYAAVEGLFVGGISAIFELWFPGIVLEAIALTFGVFMLMLLIFKSGIIKVAANTRVTTKYLNGFVEDTSIASICSLTFKTVRLTFTMSWRTSITRRIRMRAAFSAAFRMFLWSSYRQGRRWTGTFRTCVEWRADAFCWQWIRPSGRCLPRASLPMLSLSPIRES